MCVCSARFAIQDAILAIVASTVVSLSGAEPPEAQSSQKPVLGSVQRLAQYFVCPAVRNGLGSTLAFSHTVPGSRAPRYAVLTPPRAAEAPASPLSPRRGAERADPPPDASAPC